MFKKSSDQYVHPCHPITLLANPSITTFDCYLIQNSVSRTTFLTNKTSSDLSLSGKSHPHMNFSLEVS